MFVQVGVVVSLRADDRAGLARLGEVNIGVSGWQNRVGGANDGTDALLRHVDQGGWIVFATR